MNLGIYLLRPHGLHDEILLHHVSARFWGEPGGPQPPESEEARALD